MLTSYFLYQSWLEWQGHFPLAARVALSFPGQPISPTPELIGNFVHSAQERQRDFSSCNPHISPSHLCLQYPLPHHLPFPLSLNHLPLLDFQAVFPWSLSHFLLRAADGESIKQALTTLMGRKFHFMWWHLHPVTQSYPMYMIYSLG